MLSWIIANRGIIADTYENGAKNKVLCAVAYNRLKSLFYEILRRYGFVVVNPTDGVCKQFRNRDDMGFFAVFLKWDGVGEYHFCQTAVVNPF